MIVNKPAGVPSQADKTGAADLMSLLAKAKADSSGKPDTGLMLPVHRLDRPVSGLMVIARTAKIQTELSRQLAGQEEWVKTYHCVVLGCPEPQQGELIDYLVKNERLNLTQISNANRSAARKAILTYLTESTSEDPNGQPLSLFKITLKTGRHHQIRVQLANFGYPIWGDTKYNPSFRKIGGWHSLALCSTGLSFFHPVSHQQMIFSRPLPGYYPFNLFADSSIGSL